MESDNNNVINIQNQIDEELKSNNIQEENGPNGINRNIKAFREVSLEKNLSFKDNAESAPLDFLEKEQSKASKNKAQIPNTLSEIQTQNIDGNISNNLGLMDNNRRDNLALDININNNNVINPYDNNSNNHYNQNNNNNNNLNVNFENKNDKDKPEAENLGAPLSHKATNSNVNMNNINSNLDRNSLNVSNQQQDNQARQMEIDNIDKLYRLYKRKRRIRQIIFSMCFVLLCFIVVIFIASGSENRSPKKSYLISDKYQFDDNKQNVWRFLSTVKAECNNNSAMSNFNFKSTNNKDQFELNVICIYDEILYSPINKYQITTKETDIGTDLIKDVHYLDRQLVECPNKDPISSFKLNYNEQRNRISYDITCVSIQKNIDNYKKKENKLKDKYYDKIEFDCERKITGQRTGDYNLLNISGFLIGMNDHYLNGFQLKTNYATGFFYYYEYNACLDEES